MIFNAFRIREASKDGMVYYSITSKTHICEVAVKDYIHDEVIKNKYDLSSLLLTEVFNSSHMIIDTERMCSNCANIGEHKNCSIVGYCKRGGLRGDSEYWRPKK